MLSDNAIVCVNIEVYNYFKSLYNCLLLKNLIKFDTLNTTLQ